MFAAFLLPNFRLQAALRFREELSSQPVALLDEQEIKAGLLEINEVAVRNGVRVGQTSPQALARCQRLKILSRARAQEQAVQTALLEVAGMFSPEVEATADGFATLNLRGNRRKDWDALALQAVDALASLRLEAQIGLGPNADLSFLAARQAQPTLVVDAPAAFLATLAVRELDPAPDLLAVLQDWGVHNLAQLISLPRGDLMDRLGTEAARLWDRAAGVAERPLRLVQPSEDFIEACDFEREIDTAEPVLFLLRRFLDQLTLRLGHAYRVAGQMTFTLTLSNGSHYERSFTVPSPTANVAVLFRILDTHLEGLTLQHPATALRLRIIPTRAEFQQFQLFESPLRDPNRFAETLGRLAALVGQENVGVVEVHDTHQPDCYHLRMPRFDEARSDQRLEKDLSNGLPLRRYRPPHTAEVQVAQDRPVHLRAASLVGPIQQACGPYHASGGWWESNHWAIEEWDVELADGGLYRLARIGAEWCIEGSYDEAPAPVSTTDRVVALSFPFAEP